MTEIKSGTPLKTQIRHVLQLQLYIVYLIFYRVQEFLREQIRKHFIKEERKPGEIRVSRIVFKHKLDPEEISRREDFITSCGQFVELDVLDNPNWHLYCIEKERAFFVLLPRNINYYSVERFPFIYVPIYEEALAVAEVSKNELQMLGKKFEERGIPKTVSRRLYQLIVQVLFTNTARCGSTLMAKMLDRPHNSVCFGEPHALCNLSIGLSEELFTEQEAKELLNATVACLRAHTPEGQVCVLKTTSSEAKLAHLAKDIPNLKQMFMFRRKGLPSVERVVRREDFMVTILLNLYNYCPQLARFISLLHPAMEGEFVRKLKPDNLRLWSALVYASPYSYYLKNKDVYCHPIVWYHELMEETSKTLVHLFNAIDIPSNCVEAAVESKKEDSQKNTFLSWESLGHVKIPPMTNEDKEKLKNYAREMQIPLDTFDC